MAASRIRKIARGTTNTSYSKESALLANKRCILTYARSNQRTGTNTPRASVLGSFANCAWVWLSDTVRIKSGTRINFSCDGTTYGAWDGCGTISIKNQCILPPWWCAEFFNRMQHTRLAASAPWTTHEGERNQILHVCPIPSKSFLITCKRYLKS